MGSFLRSYALRGHDIDAVVDATHPFAAAMTTNAVTACASAGVPVLVLRRRFPVPVALLALLGCAVYYPLSAADGPLLLAFAVALCTV